MLPFSGKRHGLRTASLPLRQTLNVFEYGNRIYREKDLRDDSGVIQRPLGESRRPEKQGRRQEAGKMAHGRGGLRAVENQPAHITGVT